jgi:hypothetical protein
MTKQQLRKAVAGMSAERLRKVVTKLIDDIPAVERALIQELGGAKKQKAQARMVRLFENIILAVFSTFTCLIAEA